MAFTDFEKSRPAIEREYGRPEWTAGETPSELAASVLAEAERKRSAGISFPIIKSEAFAAALDRSRIGLMPSDAFAVSPDLAAFNAIFNKLRYNADASPEKRLEGVVSGCIRGDGWYAMVDFGHTVPDWNQVMRLGVSGLLARLRSARDRLAAKAPLTDRQNDFYTSCENVYSAFARYMTRLREAGCPYASPDAPESFAEALALSLFFYLAHWCGEASMRSLGGLDRLLYPFYRRDIDSGRLTKREAAALLKCYMFRMTLLDLGANTPFYLCGTLADGSAAANELSVVIINAYREMNVHNPKMQIRVARNGNKWQDEFLNAALDNTRSGMNALVFINDKVALDNAVLTGANRAFVHEYTPTGCYESTIMGHEIACTETAAVNIVKSLERTLRSDIIYEAFESFKSAVFGDLERTLDAAMSAVRRIESCYADYLVSPLLSGALDRCVEIGREAYDGGVEYENGGLNPAGFGTLCDSLAAVKYAVFDEKLCSYAELREALINNWQDADVLRVKLRARAPKWGVGDPRADSVGAELLAFIGSRMNGAPNGRGGVFKTGFYSIDRNVSFGKSTMATPDGRASGDPLARNMGPALAVNGVTAVLDSMLALDSSAFRNGGVVDVMLHPSAVAGAEGLTAFRTLLDTFIARDGFAIQFNVFDSQTLVKAQQNPAAYSDLQIRVCGWNANFVSLSKQEQDAFIRQAGGTGDTGDTRLS